MAHLKDDLANLFKVFSESLSNMNQKDFERLLKGDGKLVFATEEKTTITMEQHEDEVEKELASIANRLNLFERREEALEYLTSSKVCYLKANLIKLASMLDIYINKSDNKNELLEKIVESTVGSKIRSKAIKDTNIGKKI